MVLKVLAIAVVLVLVYIIFFKKGREKTIDANAKAKKDEKIDDIMVECPSCSTYVSKKEAILSNGFYFCSKECLLKGKK